MHDSPRIRGTGGAQRRGASRRTKVVAWAILAAACIALGWAALHLFVWVLVSD